MLIALENTTPDLNLPGSAINQKEWANFVSLFLINPDFVFNNVTDFGTESVWKNAIGTGYIIPIHNIKETIDASEESVYSTSIHDHEYKSRDGKKRIVFRINPDIYFHQDLINYSGQYWKIILLDRNNNLYTIKSGAQILGIDTDNISIEEPKIGQSPAWTNIKIELNSLFGLYVETCLFSARELKNIGVTIQNISQSVATNITFQVVGTVCNTAIEGLLTGAVVITDNISGTIAHATFTDSGNGYYTITSASNIYNGTITIFNVDYNGSSSYSFSVPEFNPLEFSSDFNIT